MNTTTTIDAYIQACPKDVQVLLEKVRQTIKKAAPNATEAISYGIPTFKLNGNLVHFGAFKNHIGFFPTASGVEAFQKELGEYAVTKGTIQFPFTKPIPYDLITKIVKFRVEESLKEDRL